MLALSKQEEEQTLRRVLFGASIVFLAAVLMLSIQAFAQGVRPKALGRATRMRPPSPTRPYKYVGTWHGKLVDLSHLRNLTVESLPGARKVGMIVNFRTGNPYYRWLNGKSLSVFAVNGAEFTPDVFVVHNGLQGPQQVYGTWVFPRK